MAKVLFSLNKYFNADALLQADNCAMLNNDGKFLEIDEKHKEIMKYSDVADKSQMMKYKFWNDYANMDDCGRVCTFKAMVRITLQTFYF